MMSVSDRFGDRFLHQRGRGAALIVLDSYQLPGIRPAAGGDAWNFSET